MMSEGMTREQIKLVSAALLPQLILELSLEDFLYLKEKYQQESLLQPVSHQGPENTGNRNVRQVG